MVQGKEQSHERRWPEAGLNSASSGQQKLDPEDGSSSRRPPALKSIRFYVMSLALLSPFVNTYSRTIINFAITDMIDPRFMVNSSKSDTEKLVVQVNGSSLPYFDLDHSCPVDDLDERQRLLNTEASDTRRAQSSAGEKFQWDEFKQGLLKAAFSIGHTPFQVPGSRMGEIYGSRLVLGVSSLLMAASCLLAPYLASLNFYLLFGDLILLGVWGSFVTPALITLFTNWLTPSEKSMMMSFYLIASRLGYALSSLLCGLLIQAQFSWRYVFFSAGLISLIFGVTFYLAARSRPQDHPLISRLELDYLESKNTLVREALAAQRGSLEMGTIQSGGQGKGKQKATNSAPWIEIITNVPVIAFVVTKFCVKLAGDTVQIELPSYLSRVMHFSPKDNGLVNAGNYIMFCGGCAGIGALANWVNKTRPFGLSKTATRKIFQSMASFGVALVLLGIAFSVCDNLSTLILLMAYFLVTTFGIGGEAQMPMDLTERYSGTIHALGSSLSISGVVEPLLVGYLLKEHAADRDRWKFVWMGASVIASIGGTVFLLFGDANIQPFDNLSLDIGSTKQEGEDGAKDKDKSRINFTTNNGQDNKAFERDVDLSLANSSNLADRPSVAHRESREI